MYYDFTFRHVIVHAPFVMENVIKYNCVRWGSRDMIILTRATRPNKKPTPQQTQNIITFDVRTLHLVLNVRITKPNILIVSLFFFFPFLYFTVFYPGDFSVHNNNKLFWEEQVVCIVRLRHWFRTLHPSTSLVRWRVRIMLVKMCKYFGVCFII